MPKTEVEMIERLYRSFNARDIDDVLCALSANVAWANGMDGGHVHGREAVRDYWTRQWAMVSPRVEPVAISEGEGGVVAVEVTQTVFDLDGRPLAGQTHGLTDKTVTHVFRIEDGMIVRFDIAGTS